MITAQNLAQVELLTGRLYKALQNSERALRIAGEVKDHFGVANALSLRAAIHLALGHMISANADFRDATLLFHAVLTSQQGVREAEGKLRRGDQAGALSQTRANLDWASRNNYQDDMCRCSALLALLLIADDPAHATSHLQDARGFANRSGAVELQLRCFHARGRAQISRSLDRPISGRTNRRRNLPRTLKHQHQLLPQSTNQQIAISFSFAG